MTWAIESLVALWQRAMGRWGRLITMREAGILVSDQRATEELLKDVVQLFRKHGTVEVRAKINGNVAKLIIRPRKLDAVPLPVDTEPPSLPRGGSVVSLDSRRADRFNPASIPQEEVEKVLKSMPREGLRRDELAKLLGLADSGTMLDRVLKPFKKAKLIKGPQRTGRIRWARSSGPAPTKTKR